MQRIIFLPGMGADHRLFEFQKKEFPSIETPAWLPPKTGETFAQYAVRMAAYIGPCDVLGGASLGGILAQEIAKHMKVKCVILMGSARSLNSVPAHFKILEKLARPFPFLPRGKLIASLVAPLFGEMNASQKSTFVSMFQDTPTSFVRWASRQLMAWPGGLDLQVRVVQIHGDKDRILPMPSENVDYVIRGGGHLINLTHAEAVNQALKIILMKT